MTNIKRGLATVGAATLALLATTACSSESNAPAQSSGSNSLAPETNEVRVSQFRLHTAATTFAAQTKGLDKAYGLEINNTWGETGTGMVAALAGGQTDFVTASAPNVVEAVTNGGVDLMIVGEMFRDKPGTTAFVTMPDSGIKGIEDLLGKKVATTGLTNASLLRLKHTMEAEGLDHNKVDWVDMPLGEITAALERGVIDAGQLTSAPLDAAIETLKTPVVYDPGAGEYDGFPALGWITSGTFAKENPNTVAAFQCAIVMGGAQAIIDDKDLYRAELKENLDWDDAAIDPVIDTNYSPTSDAEKLQLVPDLMFDMGVIKEKFDISSIVVPLPTDCEARVIE